MTARTALTAGIAATATTAMPRSPPPRPVRLTASAAEVYLRIDPSEKLEAIEALVPPALRRGRFKAPDALIASLLGRPS
ncbi:MAG TPA: hypothetical protein VGD37_30110 [Kofleriaceae bacterium]|jgi:hypothetical protein